MPSRRIVISGCSGGGKSTLINELALNGFHTVPEAGRIIVRDELESGGDALPWVDRKLFAERLATLAVQQFDLSAELDGLTFFDRCVVEALVYSQMHGFELSPPAGEAIRQCRYDDPIFVVPPWETIFDEDTERRHTFGEAVAEYGFLLKAFTEFGYKVCVVPQMANESRVKFILTELGIS